MENSRDESSALDPDLTLRGWDPEPTETLRRFIEAVKGDKRISRNAALVGACIACGTSTQRFSDATTDAERRLMCEHARTQGVTLPDSSFRY
jgi:hypothetical protein